MKKRATAYPIWNAFLPSTDSPLSLREQLVRFFRKGVTHNTLKPGIRLPASRTLAQELGVSRMTVTGVYEQLLAEGFFEARQGAGTYVASRIGIRPPAPSTPARPVLAGSLRSCQLVGLDSMSLAHPAWPLTPGLPALDAFPYALWGRLEGRFWRGRLACGASYGDPQGLLSLREALAEYLGVARGITCRPDNIIVAPGAQAAVLIAALALTDRGDRAWVESPGYDATYRSLVLAGLNTVGVPVDAEGLEVQAGRRLAPDARLALVSPSHQYPTGVTMSLARRMALLQWADEANAVILEDDYDSEFRYECAPTTALKALDGDNGRVIYVGTLSKLLMPGLRLGFLVAPDHLVDVLQRVRNGSGHRVPKSVQATAADFIGNGHLGPHIRRAKSLYTERRAALLSAIASEADGLLSVSTAATGLHLLANLPQGCDDQALTAAARAREIGAGPLSGLFVAPYTKVRHGLLMGFGNTPATSMRGAVQTLCALIEAQMRT
ncbi:PLP-dependent aminotransferase family protein [Pseudomonas sp. Irchel s3b6]|uniref:MocR-like pyridoxine biosynthesis transcription factor PdxR n=1 Tax=Pseudomonas sp. Irchel s3b6 TaxID=2009078 RepID=UPI000BA45BA7|nr:PLP-dependent aminotransferase family protein [Pseudomonas sp. Irchel s3b6]